MIPGRSGQSGMLPCHQTTLAFVSLVCYPTIKKLCGTATVGIDLLGMPTGFILLGTENPAVFVLMDL